MAKLLPLLLSALALLPSALAGGDAPSGRCTQLRVPPANVEHVLVHLDSFEGINDRANAACEERGVPAYKCESVRHELRETLHEMARLSVTEALVNVTLDHSLVYDILVENETTHEKVSTSEPLIVYPEQSLASMLEAYCARHQLSAQGCQNAQGAIFELVARDWGCQDESLSTSSRDETLAEARAHAEDTNDFAKSRRIEIPITLDGHNEVLAFDDAADAELEAARFCRDKQIHPADCATLVRLVEEEVKLLPLPQDDNSDNKSKRLRLKVTSPLSTRMYPVSERVYLEMDWATDGAEPRMVCLSFDSAPQSSGCLTVPLIETAYFSANLLTEGTRMMYFTDQKSGELVAARALTVVSPSVEVLKIGTSSSTDDVDNHLIAQIRATAFDPFDRDYRLCVLLDGVLECLNPEWFKLETQELRFASQQENLHQSVTLQLPLTHASLDNVDDEHKLAVLLMTANNKVFAMTEPLHFHVPWGVNRFTSRTHLLDPRLHTPQRPRSCPIELLSSVELRWLCDLWRHEWGRYSQNGEDGVLLEIFRHIGVQSKTYVEFGTENGRECNTRLLREAHSWTGLLMDSRFEDERLELHREFVTRENLMSLLTDKYAHLVPRDVDLLSVDVDFNDFWMVSALDLDRVAPRVILVEVNSHIPADEARTVAYDNTEDGRGGWDGFSSYFGASVAAFHRWGQRHGYSLVYCESHGVNCFLVRDDVLEVDALDDDVELSTVLTPELLQAPPNFFGRGFSYPNTSQPHHHWVWI